MKRGPLVRLTAGVLLIVVAVGAAMLARGVAQAERADRDTRAAWQPGTAPRPPAPPGWLQTAGERGLGISARSELQRAYIAYRAGLADVIPGTMYPQTQARYQVIAAIGRIRGSLRSDRDRASADAVLGRVFAESATAAGPTTQRRALRDNAVRALRRAVLGDPTSAASKHDLEVLLAEPGEARSHARGNSQQDRPGGRLAVAPRAQAPGSGY